MATNSKVSDIRWIYLVTFLDFFAVGLILPSMSMHLNKLGASFSTIGAISSIYAGTQLISGPLIGSWSDRIGRKNIFIISCLIIGVCYALFGIVESIFLMLVLRVTIGIFKHSQVMIQALITDLYPKDDQSVIFGNLKSITGLSFALGPLIAGHMTEVDGGFSLTCVVSGILFIINAVIAHYCFGDKLSRPEPKSPNDMKKNEKLKKFEMKKLKEVISDLREIDWRVFGDAFALKFMAEVAAIAFYANYNVRIKRRFDMSPKLAGYTIAYQSFIGITTGLLMGRINRKFYTDDISYRKRNLHAFTMMAVGFSCAYFSSYFPLFMLSTTIFKIADMILRVTLTEMIVEKASSTNQGSVAGSTESIGSLARMIAPLSTGIVEDICGVNSANLLSAAVSLWGVRISSKISARQSKKD
ncbi:major facilitator superfamily domain-containing protein 9 [Diachasma alloeum]|uniref:major facilitator superfamily domain-containing protein 9 n=1 Tax=Diachasma alloeum TaxID=454923 RepID=UPI0007382099|nr:major facilitator superfamily domain-containing protein 9 [Diachasma alloeum]